MRYALFWVIMQRIVVIASRPRVVLRSTATGDALLGEGRSGLAFLAIWDNDGVCSPSGKYVYIQLMISDIRQVFPKPTAQVCCQLKQQPHNQLCTENKQLEPRETSLLAAEGLCLWAGISTLHYQECAFSTRGWCTSTRCFESCFNTRRY